MQLSYIKKRVRSDLTGDGHWTIASTSLLDPHAFEKLYEEIQKKKLIDEHNVTNKSELPKCYKLENLRKYQL